MHSSSKRMLAVIPARGGSKRIHKKNIRPFYGKPMLFYTIEAIRETKLFDEIHVSSEDEDIIDLCEHHLGLTPLFKRPVELADDFTPLLPVIKFVVDEYGRQGRHFDAVYLGMPCSPLVNPIDIERIVNKYWHIRSSGASGFGLIFVARYPAPPEWAFKITGDLLQPHSVELQSVRSQDIPPSYYDAGLGGIFDASLFDGRNMDAMPLYGQEIDRSKAIDIDTEEDWKLAELIYRSFHGKNSA